MNSDWLQTAANWAQVLSVPLTLLAWLVSKEKLARFWKKSRWITFPLLSVLFTSGLYRLGCLDWLFIRSSLPVWGLAMVGLCPMVVIGLVIAWMKASEPHLDYRADKIFQVNWRWDYKSNQIDSDSISAFCPNQACRCRLKPQYDFRDVKLTCQHCGFSMDFQGDWDDLRRAVGVEIERRLNTGEFVNSLQQRK